MTDKSPHSSEPPPSGGPPFGGHHPQGEPFPYAAPPHHSGPNPYGSPQGPGAPQSGPYGPPPQYGPPQGPYGQQQGQYGGSPYGQQQPGYGAPPPPYGAPFGRQVDPKELRPRRRWIGVAWGVAVLSVAAGVILFVAGVLNTVGAVAPTSTFAPGETVTVSLNPEERPAIYFSGSGPVRYECQISGGPGQARLVNATTSQNVTENGRLWHLILLVNAPAAGDYQLTCALQEQGQGDGVFGVGRELLAEGGGLAGSVAALLLIPGAGMLGAIIVTVVVLVRRSSHRKRLMAAG